MQQLERSTLSLSLPPRRAPSLSFITPLLTLAHARAHALILLANKSCFFFFYCCSLSYSDPHEVHAHRASCARMCVCARARRACPCFHAAQKTGSEEKAPRRHHLPAFHLSPVSDSHLLPLHLHPVWLRPHLGGTMEAMGEKMEMKSEEKDEGRESSQRQKDKVTRR